MQLNDHEQSQERRLAELEQKYESLLPLVPHAVDLDKGITEGTLGGIELVAQNTMSGQPPSPLASQGIFEITIPHGITGYIPQVLGVMTFPTNMDGSLAFMSGRTVQLPWYGTFPESGVGGVTNLEMYMYTDATNVVARFRNAFPAQQVGWGGPYLFYYYLVKQDWQ